METRVCQICEKKEAYKRVVSDIDDTFFLVCKKKKCIEKLYEKIESRKPIKEFVDEVRWDRNEHQGRTYKQVSTTYKIMDTVGSVIVIGVIAGIAYMLIKFLTQ